MLYSKIHNILHHLFIYELAFDSLAICEITLVRIAITYPLEFLHTSSAFKLPQPLAVYYRPMLIQIHKPESAIDAIFVPVTLMNFQPMSSQRGE